MPMPLRTFLPTFAVLFFGGLAAVVVTFSFGWLAGLPIGVLAIAASRFTMVRPADLIHPQALVVLEQSAALQSILHAAADGILAIDANSRIDYCNRAAARLFGYDSVDMIGKRVWTFFATEQLTPASSVNLPKALSTGESVIFDAGKGFLGKRADGSHFPVEPAVTKIKFGDEFRYIYVFRDLTKQRERQEMMQLDRALLEEKVRDRTAELLGTLSALKVEIDERKKGEIALRGRAERFAQFQKTLLDLGHCDFPNRAAAIRAILEADARTLGTDQVSVWFFNADASAITCEDIYYRADGIHKSGIVLEAKDFPAYFAALKESRTIAAPNARTDPRTCEFHESYLEPHQIYAMLDVPLRLQNRLVGVVCHEQLNAPRTWELEEQDFAASISDRISLVIETFERREAQEELRRINEGLERTVTERTLSLEQELYERRKAQQEVSRLNDDLKSRALQLQSVNAELQSFSYSVSHDLRAPLRAIRGFAEILSRRYQSTWPTEAQQYLGNILEACQRMGQLIEDLLEYARLGRQGVSHQTIPLGPLFEELAQQFGGRFQEKQGLLTVAANLPSVVGDRTLLVQIFSNLIENALTYCDQGRCPDIRVDAKTQDGRASIAVRDNGLGIAAEYREIVFQVFQRLHGEEYPGTGIGLATVKKAVDLLGGRVWVESEVGVGSTFFVELPAG